MIKVQTSVEPAIDILVDDKWVLHIYRNGDTYSMDAYLASKYNKADYGDGFIEGTYFDLSEIEDELI